MPHQKKAGQSGKKGGSVIDDVIKSPASANKNESKKKSGKGKQKK